EGVAAGPPTNRPGLGPGGRGRAGLEGWYRPRVTLSAAPDALWAVYLPRVIMNAAVWVNGQFVGDGGRLRDPITRNWNRPLLFAVPAGPLAPGANTVDVNLHLQLDGAGRAVAVPGRPRRGP